MSTTNQTVSKDTWYKSVLFSFLRCSETALIIFMVFGENYYQLFNIHVSVISLISFFIFIVFFNLQIPRASISILSTFIFNFVFVLSLKALEKAKEAGRKERALCRQREQTSLGDQINLDLTYSVSRLYVVPIACFHFFC